MTSHEYRLLAYLMHHTGRVVSRTELVEHLYDQDFDRDFNTIEDSTPAELAALDREQYALYYGIVEKNPALVQAK